MRADPVAAAIVIALVSAASILGAFVFQYGFGYPPCPLCYEQRYAYYIAIPLSLMLWLALGYEAKRKVVLLGFAALAAMMLWNAGLGVYHAGVEWKWWAGPADCSGPLNNLGGPGGLLNQIQSIRVVRCDEAAWRMLGVSLAGYSALISLALAAVAVTGLRATLARRAD